MNYNKQWLIEKYSKQEKIKYLFFWGHQPSKDGTVTQSCFSQWWIAPFEVDGVRYHTAEHWMMAEKARLFKDEAIFEKIIKLPSPEMAKSLGRLVKNFNPTIWDENKFNIVTEGNIHKFSQHAELKEFLLTTGDAVLVEASPRDLIWGIGLGGSNPKAENPTLWRGRNLLGFALMEVRDQLNKES